VGNAGVISGDGGWRLSTLKLTLLYLGAFLPFAWGVAHLFPTRSIVSGFGSISLDNRRILAMEWITEGVALIFLGALVASVTMTDSTSAVALVVYLVCAGALLVLAVVSVFTGFRVNFFPFKVCPFLFSAAAAVIAAGAFL
jgi:hypothetical protein